MFLPMKEEASPYATVLGTVHISKGDTMRSINLLTTALAVSMLLATAYITSSSCGTTVYHTEPIYMTHDDGLMICEEAGLVYDYEAIGTTAEELCHD